MEYIAVYRREDDPQYDGLPVALFRDGEVMGDWHRTNNAMVGRTPVIRPVELDADDFYSEGAASVTAPSRPEVTTAEDEVFAALVAEEKARLVREGMRAAAERTAKSQLVDEGVTLAYRPVVSSPVMSSPVEAEQDSSEVPPEMGRLTDRIRERQREQERANNASGSTVTEIHEQSGSVVTEEEEAEAAKRAASQGESSGSTVPAPTSTGAADNSSDAKPDDTGDSKDGDGKPGTHKK